MSLARELQSRFLRFKYKITVRFWYFIDRRIKETRLGICFVSTLGWILYFVYFIYSCIVVIIFFIILCTFFESEFNFDTFEGKINFHSLRRIRDFSRCRLAKIKYSTRRVPSYETNHRFSTAGWFAFEVNCKSSTVSLLLTRPHNYFIGMNEIAGTHIGSGTFHRAQNPWRFACQ